MRRFVLDQLKAAPGPITSLDIAEAWIADRGLKADHGTRVMIRKRVGACLTALQASDLVLANREKPGPERQWAIAAR